MLLPARTEPILLRVITDSSGDLYGATVNGGDGPNCDDFGGCGVVFEISPPSSGDGAWVETVLHSFNFYPSDGAAPHGELLIDSHGNLYGTTASGGAGWCGVVFELMPPGSGSGLWNETILSDFTTPNPWLGSNGYAPYAGLILDSKGNLYGTTSLGGNTPDCGPGDYCGVVFELSPPSSGTGLWTETLLHSFAGESDGGAPVAGLVVDHQGNFYGTTSSGGRDWNGVVFELTHSLRIPQQ